MDFNPLNGAFLPAAISGKGATAIAVRFGSKPMTMSNKRRSRAVGQYRKRRMMLSLVAWSAIVWSAVMVIWSNPLPALADDYNRDFLLGADFSGKNLTDSSFTKANLRGSNFSNSDLHGVSFFGANLEGANFEGADLRNATLDAARFTDANLTNANLEGAFAFNAKFGGAIVDGADFTDVDVRLDAQTLLCQSAKGKNPTTGRDTRATLNCKT